MDGVGATGEPLAMYVGGLDAAEGSAAAARGSAGAEPSRRKRRQPPARKDPKKPKRALTAYMLFVKHRRGAISSENPGLDFAGVGKLLGEKWAALSDAEKEPYTQMALEDKQRNQREMKEYVPTPKAQLRQAVAYDPNKPKRAQNAYTFFNQAERPRFVSENPTMTFGQIGKLVAEAWKTMQPDEKARYHQAAAEDKARYERELSTYVPGKFVRPGVKVKKPSGPFMFFMKEKRQSLLEQSPGLSIADCGKRLGERWRGMTDDEKAPFVELANQDKERFDRETAALQVSRAPAPPAPIQQQQRILEENLLDDTVVQHALRALEVAPM